MTADENITSIPDSNFTELNHEISVADDTVSLNNNYTRQENENSIVISKSVEIEGNNHTIDSNESEAFEIDDSDLELVLKDINFKNNNLCRITGSQENITVKFINCNILFYQLDSELSIVANGTITSKSSNISLIVQYLASAIVGNLTGLDAAKKLAIWVKQNIRHETAEGFYQSPEETLIRGKGNCCCHSELFFQMCEAVGVMENYTLYFIHVGTMKFGDRHFFCMIDNICIDTDTTLSSNPWGAGGFYDRPVFSITEYPYLPVERGY